MNVAIPSVGSKKRPVMVLGGAQLGMHYGITNNTGFLTDADAGQIICGAIAEGVRTIDTARAYGESERRIGLVVGRDELPEIELFTKLDPLATVPATAPAAQAIAAAHQSLSVSRNQLKRDTLDCLILHRPEHRSNWQGAVWQMLLAEREAGSIGRLGVSVNYPEEALAAILDPDISHIQLPFNLIDHRWKDAGVIRALQERPDITVHIRSVFLQGLLATEQNPIRLQFDEIDLDELRQKVRLLVGNFDRVNGADLCVAFARAQTWADGIVIGIENVQQLRETVTLFKRPALSESEIETVSEMLPRYPEILLAPAQWTVIDKAHSRPH